MISPSEMAELIMADPIGAAARAVIQQADMIMHERVLGLQHVTEHRRKLVALSQEKAEPCDCQLLRCYTDR